ncbi:MAG: MFS transporter [Planctomycetota bacterium]
MNTTKRSSLGLIFGIVFLDIVGFSIIFPLFPRMLEHYVQLEGPDGWCGQLVTWLGELAGDEGSHAVVTLFGGVLGSLYSILQFLLAPVWGGLSDRLGRKPVLRLTLAGTAVSYVLWMFAGSFWLLIAARLLGGMMAGNISAASAVVADTTSGKERAKGMGIVGMAIGLGFILGPAIGGLTAGVTLGDGEWSRGFALNPFSASALAALALSLLNLVWMLTRFEESLPAERRGHGEGGHTLNPFGRLSEIAQPGVTRTNLIYFLYITAFAAMEFTLTFLAAERFAYSPTDNAWMFVFVGLMIAFVNGGVVRRVAPRFGERKVILAGLVILLPGFLAIAAAGGSGLFYAGLTCMAVGSALAMPCLSSLVSRYAPAERQGLVLGTFRSLGSLSRAIGPILGGLLYWSLGSAAPYYAGAAFLLLPLFAALGLPPVPEPAEA